MCCETVAKWCNRQVAHGAIEALKGLLQHLYRVAAHKALIVKLLGELDHGASVHSRLLHWEAEAEADRSCLAPTACSLLRLSVHALSHLA